MVATHVTEGQATADQLNAAIAIMRHPIIILDRDERIVAFNTAYGDLHRGADDICAARPGMPIGDLVAWRRDNGFYAPNATEVLSDANGVPIKGEATHQLGDGRWMFVDRYGLPSGLNLGVWIDVTPMKEAEARLRATAERQRNSKSNCATPSRRPRPTRWPFRPRTIVSKAGSRNAPRN